MRKSWQTLLCLRHRFSWNFTHMSYGKKSRLDISAYWENQHICIKIEGKSSFVMNLTNCGLRVQNYSSLSCQYLKTKKGTEQSCDYRQHLAARQQLLKSRCEKDRNLFLGVMLHALDSWTSLAPLKQVSTLMSYGCEREEDFFFRCQRARLQL